MSGSANRNQEEEHPPRVRPEKQAAARALGRRVSSLRTAKGLTQWELATEARVPRPWLSMVELGNTASPAPAPLMRVAEVLGTTMDYLVRGTDVEAEDPEKAAILRRLGRFSVDRLRRIERAVHDLYVSEGEEPED